MHKLLTLKIAGHDLLHPHHPQIRINTFTYVVAAVAAAQGGYDQVVKKYTLATTSLYKHNLVLAIHPSSMANGLGIGMRT